jgi:hypothetical protein
VLTSNAAHQDYTIAKQVAYRDAEDDAALKSFQNGVRSLIKSLQDLVRGPVVVLRPLNVDPYAVVVDRYAVSGQCRHLLDQTPGPRRTWALAEISALFGKGEHRFGWWQRKHEVSLAQLLADGPINSYRLAVSAVVPQAARAQRPHARDPGQASKRNLRSLFTWFLLVMPFPISGVCSQRACHDRAPGSQVADQIQPGSLGGNRV